MNGEYSWWLLVVGLTIGIIGAWLVRGSLARSDSDLAARERVEEAAWISRTIEDAGGIAPADLVAQVLELHRSYLSSPPYLMPDSVEEDEPGPAEQAALEPSPAGAPAVAQPAYEWQSAQPGPGSGPGAGIGAARGSYQAGVETGRRWSGAVPGDVRDADVLPPFGPPPTARDSRSGGTPGSAAPASTDGQAPDDTPPGTPAPGGST